MENKSAFGYTPPVADPMLSTKDRVPTVSTRAPSTLSTHAPSTLSERDKHLSTLVGRERAMADGRAMRIIGGVPPYNLVIQVFDPAQNLSHDISDDNDILTYGRQTLEDFEKGIITSVENQRAELQRERVNFKVNIAKPTKTKKKKGKNMNFIEESAGSKNFNGQLAFVPSQPVKTPEQSKKDASSKREAKARGKYLGMQVKASNGMLMTVYKYRNYHDIDVQFDDGTIVEHKEMGAFKRGQIAHPSVQAIPQKHAEAVKANTKQKASISKRLAKERKGETRIMRCGYIATIINYIDSGNVTVRFEDGCKKQKVAYAQFIIGCVAHPKKFTKPLPDGIKPGTIMEKPAAMAEKPATMMDKPAAMMEKPGTMMEMSATDSKTLIIQSTDELMPEVQAQDDKPAENPFLSATKGLGNGVKIAENPVAPVNELPIEIKSSRDIDQAAVPDIKRATPHDIKQTTPHDVSQTISLNITIPKEMLTQDNITLNIKLN